MLVRRRTRPRTGHGGRTRACLGGCHAGAWGGCCQRAGRGRPPWAWQGTPGSGGALCLWVDAAQPTGRAQHRGGVGGGAEQDGDRNQAAEGENGTGGVALGIVSYEKVAAAMLETQRQAQSLFDKIAFCCHHPKAAHPEMARCWCRKPSPGLIIESALDVAHHFGEFYPPYMGLMVGDRAEDEQCARLAGLDFQWAAGWRERAA